MACTPEVGRPAEFVARDLGRAGEFVAPRKGKICQAGPACQRQRPRGRWTRTRGERGTEAGWAEWCGSWAVRGETRAARERAERARWKGLSAGKAARGANWAVGKKGEGMTGPG